MINKQIQRMEKEIKEKEREGEGREVEGGRERYTYHN